MSVMIASSADKSVPESAVSIELQSPTRLTILIPKSLDNNDSIPLWNFRRTVGELTRTLCRTYPNCDYGSLVVSVSMHSCSDGDDFCEIIVYYPVAHFGPNADGHICLYETRDDRIIPRIVFHPSYMFATSGLGYRPIQRYEIVKDDTATVLRVHDNMTGDILLTYKYNGSPDPKVALQNEQVAWSNITEAMEKLYENWNNPHMHWDKP